MKKITSYQLVLASMALIIVLLVGFYSITYQSFKSTIRESVNDAEDLKMMRDLELLITTISNIESAQRGYMLSEDKTFIKNFESDVTSISVYLKELAAIKNDDDVYGKQLEYLHAIVNKKVGFAQSQVELVKNGRTAEAVKNNKALTGLQLMEDIKKQVFSMEKQGSQSLTRSALSKKKTAEKANLYFIFLGAVVTAILLIFYFRIRHDFKRRLFAESRLKKFNEELSLKVAEQTEAISETFERITDAVIALDKNWNFTFVNQQALKWAKLSKEDLIGKNIGDVFPAIKKQPVYMYLSEAIHSQEKVYFSEYYEPLDLWIEGNIYPSPGGVSIFLKNITEEKKAVAEVFRQKKLSDQLIDLLPGAVYLYDETGKFIRWNKELELMTGYLAKEIQALNHPADLYSNDHKHQLYERVKSVFAGEQVPTADFALKTKNGNEAYLSLNSTLINYDGRKCLLGVGINITDKKKAEASIRASEEKYRTLIERISDGFISLDKNWCYTYANAKIGDMVKMDPQTLVGKNVWELFPDAKGSPTYHAFLKAMQEQQFIQHIDYFEPLDLWQENSIYPSADGISVFIRDITVERRAQNKLAESERNLRNVLSSIVDGFYVIDKNYCFKLFNAKTVADFKHLSGKEIEEGKSMLDYLPEERKEIVIDSINKACNGETVEYEVHFNYKGLPEWGLVTYVPVKDDAGNIHGVYINFKDITVRKKAEELERKTIEHRALFASIVNYSDDAIISKTTNSIITTWNKGAEKMFGYTAAEAIGKSIHLVIPKEAASEEDFIMSKIKDGEHVEHYETLRIKKDGSLINISLTVSPILGADGNINGASAIARDITERKKAEQAILVANQRFMLISKATKEFVWDYDLIENTVWWNDNYYKELGWDKKNKSPEINSWEKNIHAEDKQRVLDRLNDILNNTTKSVWVEEYRFAKSDGSYIHVLDRGFIMRGADGKAYRILGAMTDITSQKEKETALRRSEQKYKILFENSPMPLWMFEHESRRFVDVNKAAIHRYGYTKDEFLKMTINDIRPGGEVERLDSFLPARNREGVANAGIWRHIKKDKTEILVEVFSHDTLYDGRLVRLVLPIDVTEKIRAEEELLKSREDIRNLAKHLEEVREEERTGIAREIHDELGQQLTVLKMDVSWLNKRVTPQDEKIKERFGEMEKVIDETVKTIRRISSELRPSVLDNLGIIAALEWQSNEFENRTGIVTRFTADETSINLPVKTANGVFRIFQESLTNIARHANATEADVTVNFRDGTIVLEIKDNGNGFSREKVAAKKTLGILGMTERALLLNGKCNITSKPGKGTLVEVIIPVT